MVHDWLKMSSNKYFTCLVQNLITHITKHGISYSKCKVIHLTTFIIS